MNQQNRVQLSSNVKLCHRHWDHHHRQLTDNRDLRRLLQRNEHRRLVIERLQILKNFIWNLKRKSLLINRENN